MNLANALDAQGQHAEAAAMYRETLEVQKRVLGQEHPDTLSTARTLQLLCQGQTSTCKCVTRFLSTPLPARSPVVK